MLNARVTGARELRRNVDKLTDRTRDAVNEAAVDEARATHDDEREFVPYLTGELYENIEVWFEDVDGSTVAHVGIRNRELFWAVFIEWGRSSAAAQPFATPASELARKRWPKRARRAARQALDK